MVMVTMVVTMVYRGKRRSCKHHRKKREGHEFLH